MSAETPRHRETEATGADAGTPPSEVFLTGFAISEVGKSGFTEIARIVTAVVQVGDETVPYERAGRGSPVLLLPCDAVYEAWHRETFEAMAWKRRVYRPTVPMPRRRDQAERWIQGLVEALGLRVPDVVAEAELAPVLSRLVRRNGGFVGQVLFLQPRRPR